MMMIFPQKMLSGQGLGKLRQPFFTIFADCLRTWRLKAYRKGREGLAKNAKKFPLRTGVPECQ
jgi:hypothetical protein